MTTINTRFPMQQSRFLKSLLLAAGLSALAANAQAQSTIIIDSATNNGGFESGATGWTIVNGGQTNQWRIDATATAGFSGVNAAFISNSTTTPYAHTYTNSATSVVQFYQDVTLPAGQNLATLSFKMILGGEAGYDRIRVFLAPTTVTPTAGTEMGGAYQIGGDIDVVATPWQTINLGIPRTLTGNATAATTRRLIIQWRNDGSGGVQPPAGIDNITLTTYCNGTAVTTATVSAQQRDAQLECFYRRYRLYGAL